MYNSRGTISIQAIILAFIVVIAVSTLLLALSSATVASADKIRLSDIQQMSAALKLFFDENGFYPSSDGSSVPVGITSYLDFWPQAPKRQCDKTAGIYLYAPKSSGQDYNLKFCLEAGAGNLAAGAHTVSSKGID
jgi:hypothetical protein